MKSKTFSFTMLALDRDGVCKAQAPGGAGDMTINGDGTGSAVVAAGVATFDVPRRVGIYAGGDNSGKTFTVYGTNRYGVSISEAVTGPNATTVNTTADFKTVTRVAISAASTGDVEVGTCGVASTAWWPVDRVASVTYRGHKSSDQNFTYALHVTAENPFSTTFNTDAASPVTPTWTNDVATIGPYAAARLYITAFVAGTAYLDVVVPRDTI